MLILFLLISFILTFRSQTNMRHGPTKTHEHTRTFSRKSKYETRKKKTELKQWKAKLRAKREKIEADLKAKKRADIAYQASLDGC
jgi:hypothetical protein